MYIMAPIQLVGSRAKVWHGTAKKTAYGKKGLTKSQLIKVKGGIKSRKARAAALKNKTLKKWMKKKLQNQKIL